MNEKTKKTLKKVGMIAGGVAGAAGLMYVGYLAGAGFVPKLGNAFTGFDKSTLAGKAVDICLKPKLVPGKHGIGYALTKEQAIDAVKTINKLIQEVN